MDRTPRHRLKIGLSTDDTDYQKISCNGHFGVHLNLCISVKSVDKESPRVNVENDNERLAALPLAERLRWAWAQWGARAAIGTSFQGAGLVIIATAVREGLPFPVFTLDTGLLFPETIELKSRLEKHFGIAIEALAPERTVAQQAEDIAPELWASDPDLCCTLRKVEPLRNWLSTLDCWITGVRREQSDTRATTGLLESYALEGGGSERPLAKLNPVADWSRQQVWDFLKEHGVPYNPLHDRGYRSIGCVPCTRPTASGESERAGRWTGFQKAECGIHTFLRK